ncbi:MAG: hypothetical protein SVU32_07250, partial [Candidatus Nanohaloarchaea archaeon]|nr:hypothetical protein [Candidatus Nanohaloarchaea archaeon]
GVFQLIMGLSVLQLHFNPYQLGAFYIFGHVFLYLSIAYYSRIPTHIWRPDWEIPVFGINLLAGAGITLINIVKWNQPVIKHGVIIWNVPMPVGPLIGLLVVANFIFGGLIFFSKLALDRSGVERYKLLLIALGLTLMSIAGPIHDNTTSLKMLAAADVLTT